MAALFAYLIAVVLLLGGGYGALSWFATPELVKVVAKAKPNPPSTQTVPVAAPTSAQASPPKVADPVPAEAKPSPPQREAVAEAKQPSEKQEPSQESKQENKQESKQVEAAPATNAASNTASTSIAKPKRPSHRHANRPPDKRGLALMTLRTIEFPDGRRETMLIPYRDNRRAMALDPEW